ncbi:MAG TPA: type I-C CRISPR-associated protein Cas5c [Smithellaceae bacterium]|nr:type I-C CRISPR-associated protein Cas5c [Smithellaceae bacterium]
MRNSIEFKVWGHYALFTDPITKIGGEKCSYHIPTYEALKGIIKSIYWKPTIIWYVDEVRVMKRIQTQTKGMKPLNYDGIYSSVNNSGKKQKPFNTLSIYNYLKDVEYQVLAHFEWNEYRSELKKDRVDGKHHCIAKRMLARGGRQDIFLGTRDCQGYVEPCRYGEGKGYYDDTEELSFGLAFHGFDYPDETGKNEFASRFWYPKMIRGEIKFIRPEECSIIKPIRGMYPKIFRPDINFSGIREEGLSDGLDCSAM